MWTCPKCKHKFYNVNQSHSCGAYSIEDFIKGKAETSVQLFYDFLYAYKKIGDFELHPVKTRVALLTKMRFASVNKIGVDYIDIHLVLTENYPENECFYKIDNLENRFYVCHARLKHKNDINPELFKYMNLAYDTGSRKHVTKKPKQA